jgi:hypothetical protein
MALSRRLFVLPVRVGRRRPDRPRRRPRIRCRVSGLWCKGPPPISPPRGIRGGRPRRIRSHRVYKKTLKLPGQQYCNCLLKRCRPLWHEGRSSTAVRKYLCNARRPPACHRSRTAGTHGTIAQPGRRVSPACPDLLSREMTAGLRVIRRGPALPRARAL